MHPWCKGGSVFGDFNHGRLCSELNVSWAFGAKKETWCLVCIINEIWAVSLLIVSFSHVHGDRSIEDVISKTVQDCKVGFNWKEFSNIKLKHT